MTSESQQPTRHAAPGTVWTRADTLRVGDRIGIGDEAHDRWARVVAIEYVDPQGCMRLHLAFELDGACIARCVQTPTGDDSYLRLLPRASVEAAIPVTTVEGLEAAWRIYDREWDVDGTVAVRLPAAIVGQLLRDRGWARLHGLGGTGPAWTAPGGERFPATSVAVRFALTAEYADVSAVSQ